MPSVAGSHTGSDGDAYGVLVVLQPADAGRVVVGQVVPRPSEPDPVVVSVSCLWLALSSDPSAHEALRRVMTAGSLPTVRIAAIRAMEASSGAPGNVPILREALADPDERVRVMAAMRGEKLKFVSKRPGDAEPQVREIEPRNEKGDKKFMIGLSPSESTELLSQRYAPTESKGPVMPGSSAANAAPPFAFGDKIVATTVPTTFVLFAGQNNDLVLKQRLALPGTPAATRQQEDVLELRGQAADYVV